MIGEKDCGMPKRKNPKPQSEALKGWKQIAEFLGYPAAVVQRWASEGMPVRREGRFVTTTPEELKCLVREGIGQTSACSDGGHRPDLIRHNTAESESSAHLS
jgi:phage terminase Nu1 subunit (DNA packaging protein)